MSDTIHAVEETTDETPVTYSWEVWRHRFAGDAETHRPVLEFCGEIVSEYAYSPVFYGSDALEEIARLGDGPGDYVLIHDERLVRVSIVAETKYREA